MEAKGEAEDENASNPDRLVAVGVLEEVDDSPSLGMGAERGTAPSLGMDAERGTAGAGIDGGGGVLLLLLDANRFWPLTEAKGELVDA